MNEFVERRCPFCKALNTCNKRDGTRCWQCEEIIPARKKKEKNVKESTLVNRKCPQCGYVNTFARIRIGHFVWCENCDHEWKLRASVKKVGRYSCEGHLDLFPPHLTPLSQKDRDNFNDIANIICDAVSFVDGRDTDCFSVGFRQDLLKDLVDLRDLFWSMAEE